MITGIILTFILIQALLLAHVVISINRKHYRGNRMSNAGTPTPYACGRVHLGPVEEKRVGTMRWQVCHGCGNKLSNEESLKYWQIKRTAIKCREEALLGARTK